MIYFAHQTLELLPISYSTGTLSIGSSFLHLSHLKYGAQGCYEHCRIQIGSSCILGLSNPLQCLQQIGGERREKKLWNRLKYSSRMEVPGRDIWADSEMWKYNRQLCSKKALNSSPLPLWKIPNSWAWVIRASMIHFRSTRSFHWIKALQAQACSLTQQALRESLLTAGVQYILVDCPFTFWWTFVFPFLAIINKAAIYILVRVFGWTYAFNSPG